MSCKAYFDGASRGNPGSASAGAIILDENDIPLWKLSLFLGEKTNNEAEYTALLKLLEELERKNITGAHIYGDSRLVVNQVNGVWKVRNERLGTLYRSVRKMMDHGKHTLAWIPREENSYADRLCNEALDPPHRGERSAFFSPEKLDRAGDHIFIAHGTEDYAVDTLHGSCSCPAFRHRGDCRHLRAARKLEKGKRE